MSFPFNSKVICACCGTEQEFTFWPPSDECQVQDLDFRSSEPYRSEFFMTEVFQCPNCDYCNSNLNEGPNGIQELVNSNEYKLQLENEAYTNWAKVLLCKSMVLKKSLKFEESAIACLHAAWICDDENKYVQSKNCRKRAVELFHLANTVSSIKKCSKSEFSLLMIDLYRRIEDFPSALSICEARMDLEDQETYQSMLFFQKQLISNEDVACYTIKEAEEYFKDYLDRNQDNLALDQSDFLEDANYYDDDYQQDYERDYFDAMTDGQLGDFDDFMDNGGNIDDIDTWSRG